MKTSTSYCELQVNVKDPLAHVQMKRSEKAPLIASKGDFFTPLAYEQGLRSVLNAYFNDEGADSKRQPRRLKDIRKAFQKFVLLQKRAPDISAPNPTISSERLKAIYYINTLLLLAILCRLYLLSSVTDGDTTDFLRPKKKSRLFLPENPSEEASLQVQGRVHVQGHVHVHVVEPEAVFIMGALPDAADPARAATSKRTNKSPIGLANALGSADIYFIKNYVSMASSLLKSDQLHILDEILILCEGYQYHSLTHASDRSFADDFEEDVIESVLDYIEIYLPADNDYRDFGSPSVVVERALEP